MSTNFVFSGSYTPSTPLAFNFAPSTTFTFVASGGAVTGGAAGFSTTASPPAGGDIISGGSATVTRTFAHDTAGGITVGGSADASFTAGESDTPIGWLWQFLRLPEKKTKPKPKTWAHTATGGVRAGGAADVAFTPVEPRVFQHTAIGGKRTGGLAQASHVDTLAIIRAQDDEALLLGVLAA